MLRVGGMAPASARTGSTKAMLRLLTNESYWATCQMHVEHRVVQRVVNIVRTRTIIRMHQTEMVHTRGITNIMVFNRT